MTDNESTNLVETTDNTNNSSFVKPTKLSPKKRISQIKKAIRNGRMDSRLGKIMIQSFQKDVKPVKQKEKQPKIKKH